MGCVKSKPKKEKPPAQAAGDAQPHLLRHEHRPQPLKPPAEEQQQQQRLATPSPLPSLSTRGSPKVSPPAAGGAPTHTDRGLSPSRPAAAAAPVPTLGARGGSVRYGLAAQKHGLLISQGICRRVEQDMHVNIALGPKGGEQDYIFIEGEAAAVRAAHCVVERELGIDLPEGDVVVYTVEVPRHRYGAVLGTGGSTLRTIESEARAAVKVPRRNDADGHVQVKGTDAACQRCVAKLEAIVRQSLTVRKAHGGGGEHVVTNVPPVDLRKPVGRALFFPNHREPEGCMTIDIFLSYIRAVTATLDICIFTVTSDTIANAVLDVHRRGVRVRVICDDDQMKSQGSDIGKFINAGIECRTDDKPEHMHNKFAVLDGRVLLNGSFNWTVQGTEGNNENVILTSDPSLVRPFAEYYNDLWRRVSF